MLRLNINNLQVIAYTELATSVPGGYVLSGANIAIEFKQKPIQYYRHGWQSWSLSTWHPVDLNFPVMQPEIFHSRQTDMVYAKYPNPNGSWLGALEFGDGNILFIGALGLEAHVAYRESTLQGWYENGTGNWFAAYGEEQAVFTRYAELLAERFGRVAAKTAPRVWCSWYSFYTTVAEGKLLKALDSLGILPFDVFQIDDGWQESPGDWEPNAKFPLGMVNLAERIKATGRTAGLWLAPLAVGKSSSIFREHQDWLLHDSDGKLVFAGFEWGDEAYALDATHPEAAEWLTDLIRKVRGWGYDYLKLDFLYAGALPGKRYQDIPRETAYRRTLKIIREAAGDDTYLLTCGTPILPALGLCDAMRVGADVANYWDSHLYSYLLYNLTTPGVKNGIRTTINRLWLKPLVHVDPDVAFFSESEKLSPEQKQLFIQLTDVCGFKASSDPPQAWTDAQRDAIHQWLESNPEVQRTGRYTFTLDGHPVDFNSAMPLPPPPTGFDAFLYHLIGFLANQMWLLKLWNLLLRNEVTKED